MDKLAVDKQGPGIREEGDMKRDRGRSVWREERADLMRYREIGPHGSHYMDTSI